MSRAGVFVVAVMIVVLPYQVASAQWCPIDVVGQLDVENDCWEGPDGIINITDISAVIQAFQGVFVGYCDGTPTEERMDLNCDGQLTPQDQAVFDCINLGGSDLDCCPVCEPASSVPAVSTWGMLALLLLVMSAGSVVFRHALVRPAA